MKKILTLLFISFLFSNANAQGDTLRFTIDHYKSTYVGEGRHSAYRIKEAGEKWHQLMDGIEGFNYEWGYRYEIIVLETEVEFPPEDGSSLAYTLIEQLSKTSFESELFRMVVYGDDDHFGLSGMINKAEDGGYELLYEVEIVEGVNLDLLLENLTKEGIKVQFSHSGGRLIVREVG